MPAMLHLCLSVNHLERDVWTRKTVRPTQLLNGIKVDLEPSGVLGEAFASGFLEDGDKGKTAGQPDLVSNHCASWVQGLGAHCGAEWQAAID